MGRAPKKPNEELLSGLQSDLKGLIIRFIATESVRYEEFAKIWRALNFPLIFLGLKNEALLQTFTSEAFALSASSLVKPHDLQTRICAMYMLYALYYTQPCSQKVKIRMDPVHWKALMDLSKEIKEQGHLDAAYIFLKMHNDKIFQFTASLRHASYTRHKTGDGEYEKWRAGKELMTTTFNPDLLEQLHGLHNHYQQMKQDMGFQDNLSMKLVRESMADYIIQRVHVHQLSDEEEEESEQEREANPAQERAARIAMIKKKSFTKKGQGSSSQRHLQEAASSASEMELDEKRPSPARGRGRPRRKKMPGRKPVKKDHPPTEMEKKKAWSILPMRRLIDVEEEEQEDNDEDSDVEQERKKKTGSKSSKTNTDKGKKKSQKKSEKRKKKKKRKKEERVKSETETSAVETSGDERLVSAQSETDDTGSSPRKRDRKRKRTSSASEAEGSSGKRRRKEKKKRKEKRKERERRKSESEGLEDSEMGWLESEADSPNKGESPKGKSPKGKSPKGKSPEKGVSPKKETAQISFCESDDDISPLAHEMVSPKRKVRGRPKKSFMPDENIEPLRHTSDHDDHHAGELVGDSGPTTGGDELNTGVFVDISVDPTELLNRSPSKKVLLGLKKPALRKESDGGRSKVTEHAGNGEERSKENTGMKKELRQTSPRKTLRPRRVAKK